ncbi:MAG: hypothetical protein IT374_20265, partial [Polyangiaceae bacterium]|nr:hypothetical protein [Polyangiaceae bacterium]
MAETLLGAASLAISIGVAVVGALLRYTIVRQDAERERRFRDLERDVDLLKTKEHAAEV